MYFNFEDDRPDTPTLAHALSAREGVMLSVIVHLIAVIMILILPSLPFMKRMQEERLQAIEQQRLQELERQRERQNARFVFVQPRVERPAPKPPPRAELSDIDRQARTRERAPNPTNPVPFSRGNSAEKIVGPESQQPPRQMESLPPPPQLADGDPSRQGLPLPEAPNGFEQKSSETARQENGNKGVGIIADAIRNVQKYAQGESFANLQGGGHLDNSDIQFDTKGVEFGPWLRRFLAQVRANWIPLIPQAAMSLRGHAVITFYVHRNGRITDVTVAKPSVVDGFTRAAEGAMLTSNPTLPLPAEYPEDKMFVTIRFSVNERY